MASIYKTDTIALRKKMAEKEIRTIGELSQKTGINRNTLSQVLNEIIQPSADVMDKLVLVLEITPDEAGHIFFSINLRDRKVNKKTRCKNEHSHMM